MQQNSENNSEFSERTERLASEMRVNLSDLPEKIGVSDSMFYAYRSGKCRISAKAWRKLEAAEKAAGIGQTKEISAVLREDPGNYSLREPDEPTMEERLENMQRTLDAQQKLLDENKGALEAMRKAMDDLTDLFTNRRFKQ